MSLQPVAPAVPSLDFMRDGLCAQTDPEAFHPEKGGSTREAKRVCVGCEVKGPCLEYALVTQQRFGIWGGLSERERRLLKHAPAAAPAPEPVVQLVPYPVPPPPAPEPQPEPEQPLTGKALTGKALTWYRDLRDQGYTPQHSRRTAVRWAETDVRRTP